MLNKGKLFFCWMALGLALAACSSVAIPGRKPTSAPATAPVIVMYDTPAPTPSQVSSPTVLAAPTNTPTPTPAPAQVAPTLRLLADGFAHPVYLTHSGDDSGRLFIVEKAGRVLVLQEGAPRDTPFLDIRKQVGSDGSEQGLLSIAFAPNFAFAPNPVVFVDYTDLEGDTVISKFQVNRENMTADPETETIVLKVDQPYANHNGGLLVFGSDGMLYIGMGDGGSQGDPQNNAQNVGSLLGKILRVDVMSSGAKPYVVPSTNPEWDEAGRTAIWALGLRNPWRFSFDRATDDLYIGDVGQSLQEEVNFQPAGVGGLNYGWKLREGLEAYQDGQNAAYFTDPIYDYPRADGCSVIGGYVYRGAAFTDLVGKYVYGDYCSGKIWTLSRDASGQWQNADLLDSGFQISSFGEDCCAAK